MYQFISSMSRRASGTGIWVDDDISNIPLNTLMSEYSKIIVTLSNQFLPNNVIVDLGSILPNTNGLTLTLTQFLIENGNKTLPTLPIDTIPKLTTAKYADAFKAGYSIVAVNPNTSVTANQPESDKNWLYLTKPTLDYNLFFKSCLVNINGFFHLTDTDGTGIYCVDGMKTLRKSNMNQIGIYSFAELGSLEFVQIKPEMIYKQYLDQKYSDGVFIDIGTDISDKTVLLVLGGYLHLMADDVFKPINNTSFRISLNNIPLLDRYFNSKEYLDFSSLPLTTTIRNKNQISIFEFFSDANIMAYLTLSQSFFIILDNPDVYVTKSPVRKTPYGDMFISYEKPEYPLVVQNGKIINYWATYEDGQYSIVATDTMHTNYNYNTVDAVNENSVDNTALTNKPSIYSDAYFLKITSLNI